MGWFGGGKGGLVWPLALAVALLTAGPPAKAAQPPSARPLALVEAVRLALANNANISLAQQDVAASQGSLDIARGAFDLTLSSNISQGHVFTPLAQLYRQAYGRTFQTTNTTSFQLGAQKLLRSGLTLQPNVTVSRMHDTLDYPELPASQASVNFAVIVPLLQGLGERAVGAQERAAQYQLEGVRQDYLQAAAANVYTAVADYWSLLEYQTIVTVYADSEQRAAKLLEESTALVEADQLPRSEITNLRANLDLKSAQRLSAASDLSSAQEALANSLGLGDQGFDGPVAVDDFPYQADVESIAGGLATEKFKQMALANRADLKSAKLKEKSANETLVAALDGLKPKLNLTLSAGYSGLSEDEAYSSYYRSLGDGVYGLNAVGSLNLEFPPANTAARGQVAASRAALQQSKIVLTETQRQVLLGVSSAVRELRASAQQVRLAREAVASYQRAVQDERLKLKLGTSTILAVIQVEDQLTSALLNEADARQRLATAVARIRYETGTLITGDPTAARFSVGSITTPPQADGSR